MKLQVFNSSYLCGKSNFDDDGIQNYLESQSLDILDWLLILITSIESINPMMNRIIVLLHY